MVPRNRLGGFRRYSDRLVVQSHQQARLDASTPPEATSRLSLGLNRSPTPKPRTPHLSILGAFLIDLVYRGHLEVQNVCANLGQVGLGQPPADTLHRLEFPRLGREESSSNAPDIRMLDCVSDYCHVIGLDPSHIKFAEVNALLFIQM